MHKHIPFSFLLASNPSFNVIENEPGSVNKGIYKKNTTNNSVCVGSCVCVCTVRSNKLPKSAACIIASSLCKSQKIMASVQCAYWCWFANIWSIECQRIKSRSMDVCIAVDDDDDALCIQSWAHGLGALACVCVRFKWIKTADIGIKYSQVSGNQPASPAAIAPN